MIISPNRNCHNLTVRTYDTTMSVIAVTTTRQRDDLKEADLIVDSLDELKPDDFMKLIIK